MNELGPFLFGLMVGVPCGGLLIAAWWDKATHCTPTTRPPAVEADTTRLPPYPIHDLPRRPRATFEEMA